MLHRNDDVAELFATSSKGVQASLIRCYEDVLICTNSAHLLDRHRKNELHIARLNNPVAGAAHQACIPLFFLGSRIVGRFLLQKNTVKYSCNLLFICETVHFS